MWLGMTYGEWGLTAFIFAVVYSAGFVGRFGAYVGGLFSAKDRAPGAREE